MDEMNKHRTLYRLETAARTGSIMLGQDELGQVLRYHAGKNDRIAINCRAVVEHPLRDYPCGINFAPVFSTRAVDRFREMLSNAGELVEIGVQGWEGPPYHLLVVRSVVDCLDVARSSPVDYANRIAKPIFEPSKVPTQPTAFCLPQTGANVFWTDAAVELFRAFPLDGVDYTAFWSTDPSIPVPIEPMA